jgi:hypothetical protein
MTRSLLAVVVDCRDCLAQANWWATALGHQVSERNPNEYEVHDPAARATPLYFMNVPEPKSGKNRVHIDFATDIPLEDEVARLIAAGATLVEVRQDPDTYANPDTLAVMQDPEGNEFCVLIGESVTGLV